MPYTVNAFNHAEWEGHGLKDFGDFADAVEYINEQESGYGDLEGEWYFVDDEPLPNGDRVIYYGTHGNDHSPGASMYTNAVIFNKNTELAEFRKRRKQWQGYSIHPGWEHD